MLVGAKFAKLCRNRYHRKESAPSEEMEECGGKFTSKCKKFPLLLTRLGRSKSHQVHTTFMDPLIRRQNRGRRMPIYIQDRVTEEFKALVKDGHVTKLDKSTTDHFINPIMITAKKNGSIKLAMDAKPLNQCSNLEK